MHIKLDNSDIVSPRIAVFLKLGVVALRPFAHLVPSGCRGVGLNLSIAALAAAFSLNAAAAEPRLPDLRPGLWEFHGREAGRKIDSQRCASPSEELRVENAALAKLGCEFSPLAQSAVASSYQSACDLKTRRGRALISKRISVIKVRGDQAFELSVKGTSNGNPVDDLIIGKRIGECAKSP